MPAHRIPMQGRRFGRLVVRDEEPVYRRNRLYWPCQCDCGARKIICGSLLIQGESKSCGCLRKELVGKRSRTHGMKALKAYRVWAHMKARCQNQTHLAFARYGGRGITVCALWANSFEAFYADMGDPPAGRSIERLDNNRGYELWNCTWATRMEQNNNTRACRYLTWNNQTMSISAWARHLGLSRSQIACRVAAGYPPELVLSAEKFNTGYPRDERGRFKSGGRRGDL